MRFIEYGFIALLILAFLTQVFLPVVLRRPLFPMFRKKTHRDSQLKAARADLAEAAKEAELAELDAEIERVKQRVSDPDQPDAEAEPEASSTEEN